MTPSERVPVSTNRLVLFVTQEVPADVPGGDAKLACLLPLGSATFLERLMDSCVLAGVREVDLVVSDHPEALRSTLMDGAPWGIKLHWHHAKESASPYTALRGLQLSAAQLTLFGHGHQWVSSRILRELMAAPALALQLDSEFSWTGWFSAHGDVVWSLGGHLDYTALAQRLRGLEGQRCVMAGASERAGAESARSLLMAQRHALEDGPESGIPATWLRMPWGAASPEAQVHAQAVLHGPLLVGPGCVVEAGAEIGPGAVLTRDVFVATGAQISHSLVLPNTYVGGQVALESAVAQGQSIQSLKWDVRTVLAQDDALMMPLRSQDHTARTPLLSRLLALLAVAALLPCLPVLLLLQQLLTGRVGWSRQAMVRARQAEPDQLVWITLRMAHSHQSLDRCAGWYGAVLDIVQGRRNWFGIRPRSEAEWHALGRDWQNLFSASAIGLFHATAWSESSQSLNHEAYAAADAFMAVQRSTLGRLKMLCNGTARSA